MKFFLLFSLKRATFLFALTLAIASNAAFSQDAAQNKTIESPTKPASDQEELATPLVEKIRELAEAYVDGDVINSAAIGIIQGDAELVLGVGQLSEKNAAAPDQDTVFEIGSVSKVFTGVLLADAIERGVVKADQPADDLLPEGISMPVFSKKPDRKITLADLSTHVSGLPRLPDNLDVNATIPYAEYSADDLYEFLKSYELKRAPGTVDEYSNLGVGLLGVLLSRKQNTDYESLIRERITEPLQMKDTSITLSKDQSNRLAPPNDGSRTPPPNWEFDALAGAGAIRSTAGDMLKFLRANLTPPDNETGAAIDLAFTRQRKSKGGGLAMGFGWMINGGSKTHWHNGGTAGYTSIIFVNRKQKRALVILCNTFTPEIDRLGAEIMALLDGKDVEPRTFRKAIDVSPEVCARYVGRYKLDEAIMFDIAYANDEKTLLTVQLTGQSALPIFPESETLWFLKLVAADIDFTVDENGKCSALTLIQGGLKQTAKKQ